MYTPGGWEARLASLCPARRAHAARAPRAHGAAGRPEGAASGRARRVPGRWSCTRRAASPAGTGLPSRSTSTPARMRSSRRPAPRSGTARPAPARQRSTRAWAPARRSSGCRRRPSCSTARARNPRRRSRSTGDAVFVGWDIVCLGRTASGERFDPRHLSPALRIGARRRTGLGRAHDLEAGPLSRPRRWACMGARCLAHSWLRPRRSPTTCWRRAGASDADARRTEGALTRLPGVLVARCRGTFAGSRAAVVHALWSVVRPAVVRPRRGPPRIWNT